MVVARDSGPGPRSARGTEPVCVVGGGRGGRLMVLSGVLWCEPGGTPMLHALHVLALHLCYMYYIYMHYTVALHALHIHVLLVLSVLIYCMHYLYYMYCMYCTHYLYCLYYPVTIPMCSGGPACLMSPPS